MKGLVAVALKELVELAPATIVAAALVGAAGFNHWDSVQPHSGSRNLIVLVACAIGLWHGVLDRRAAASLFSRHRPTASVAVQLARWSAGLTSLLLLFGAFDAGRRVGIRTASASAIESVINDPRRELVGVWALPLIVWTFELATVAWCVCRATIAWPGKVAPIVWVIVLPASVVFAVIAAGFHVMPVALVLIVVSSLYQATQNTTANAGVRA